jgi:1-pyrroline-5-carboxylate dehydrogenase
MAIFPEPVNEPVLSYAPGTLERAELSRALEAQTGAVEDLPLFIGGQAVMTPETRSFSAPHDHALTLGRHALARDEDVRGAIAAALEARSSWSALGLEARAAVFLKAASLLAGPWRQRLNAATVLNQSKTAHQAEIDAACELVDFFRYNVHFAARLAEEQPKSLPSERNTLEQRPLDGFVYAVTPFNFTSIAGNLPTAPALMGNTVVWKPSPYAALSAHRVLELLAAAGLPDGVINLVHGDAQGVTRHVLEHSDFAALHYTGSTAVLRSIWRQIADRLDHYRSYPRIVGESGGKDFLIAHASAELDSLAVAIARGAFEFQGQKCSAVSRVYVARSLWPALEQKLRAIVGEMKLGDPADYRNFIGAVIARHAYDRITEYQKLAQSDASCRVITGGNASDERGFFIEPTLVETSDPKHRLMQEEIFGPLAAIFVYDDSRYEDVLALCDSTSPYALTGAIFARDRQAIELAASRLRHAAGNFYVNDKPTGAVVGQQPFGGSRLSGTNDKAGSAFNLTRFVSPRAVKENYVPPRDWKYPFLG